MEDTSKYLIHARITADGVVERSDVVGAVFGQTEGLLGDELDLRDLQRSSKIGRIDVQIDSEHGQSFGTITITSSLDKVETAILAASLEAITRVGPCEARVEVADIEDMRAAKRREVVERAKDLLAESFDDSVMDSTEILEEVREAQRVEQIDNYRGFPAGPRVADSDAIVVVEGRADVLTLLEYGIKNAVAVEGTNVPDEIAELTQDRTVTAFLDSDRGGDLILRELSQVADVDYVAVAPEGKSVEDLSRGQVMDALREKTPSDVLDAGGDHASPAATDGSVHPAPDDGDDTPHPSPETPPKPEFGTDRHDSVTASDATTTPVDATDVTEPESVADPTVPDGDTHAAEAPTTDPDDGRTTGSVRANSDQTTDTVGGVGGEANESGGAVPDASAESVGDEGLDGTPVDDSTEDPTDDALPDDATSDDAVPDDATDDEPSADDARLDSASEDGEAESGTDASGDAEEDASEDASENAKEGDDSDPGTDGPATLRDHVRDVIDGGSKRARLLDDEFGVLTEVPSGEAFDTLADGDAGGFALVIDDCLDQRLLDVAAQRGVEQIVAATEGEFVKRPASVRIVTADQLAS